jgi:hypothetical protein
MLYLSNAASETHSAIVFAAAAVWTFRLQLIQSFAKGVIENVMFHALMVLQLLLLQEH